MADATIVTCPSCNGAVEVDASPVQRVENCPHCSAEFVVPPTEDAPRNQDEELSELKIRQLSSLRRSLIRSRSYCIISMVLCAVAGAQFMMIAIEDIRAGAKAASAGFVLASLACFGLILPLFRKARQLQAQLDAPREEPPTNPDFSTLQDGSQTFRNLEEI